jgi:hypothetical protein
MYEVVWLRTATDRLAEICLNHPNQWNDIDAAENDVDYRLRRDPFHFSQAVAEGLRRIISPPLVVYFSVAGKRIEIEGVGWIE